MPTASQILGDQVGSTAPVFLAFLAIHVLGGLTAVITGAVAALTRKGSPRHIRAGRWYYRAITVVFATATILAVVRWRQDPGRPAGGAPRRPQKSRPGSRLPPTASRCSPPTSLPPSKASTRARSLSAG